MITLRRRNMKSRLMRVWDRQLLRKRSLIETINDQLKNISQIEHSHRSLGGFMVNLVAGLIAYTYQPKKPSFWPAVYAVRPACRDVGLSRIQVNRLTSVQWHKRHGNHNPTPPPTKPSRRWLTAYAPFLLQLPPPRTSHCRPPTASAPAPHGRCYAAAQIAHARILLANSYLSFNGPNRRF